MLTKLLFLNTSTHYPSLKIVILSGAKCASTSSAKDPLEVRTIGVVCTNDVLKLGQCKLKVRASAFHPVCLVGTGIGIMRVTWQPGRGEDAEERKGSDAKYLRRCGT